MSIYDILMLAVMVGSILFGLWKGLAWQIASIAAIVVSYFVAINFRGPVSTYISAEEPWNRFAAMLILFIGTSLVIWIIYGFMKSTIRRWRLRGFDTQAGGIAGAIQGIALCMLITLFAVTLFGDNIRQGVVTSRSGGYLAAAINRMHSMFPEEVHLVLDPHIQKFNENLNETDPDFLNESHEKLNQKLQVFRGSFEDLGTSAPPQRTVNQNNFGTGVSEDNRTSQATTLGEQFRDEVGNQLLDATKEAGKKFINDVNDSINRLP